jgi:hypothetical protein
MPFDSYQSLREAVLSWIARPGDLLVAPSVPDMITLFEREARRRLRVGDAEVRAVQTVSGTAAVALPADCRELRLVTSGGFPLAYVTPMELSGGAGQPRQYTLHGRELRLGPAPSGNVTVEILYQIGVPPLSDANPTNWLLTEHPDAYLYGALANAEAFIGHDERIQLWLAAREAAFASIEQADRKARWAGPLTIRPELYGAPATGNAWTVVAPASAPGAPIQIVQTTTLPFGSTGDVNVANAAGAPITITLPPSPALGQWLKIKDVLGNAGAWPITIVAAVAVLVSDSGLVLTSDSGAVLTVPSLIDGNPTYQLLSNYGSIEVYWMGTQWGTR